MAVFYGFPLLIALGLVAGLCSSLGKLSLDAMIQRDVPETVRTSVFARSETVLQLSWVIGGGCGIVLPLIPRLGFGFLAGVLIVAVILVIRQKPAPQPPSHPRSSGADGPSPHTTVTPTPHQDSRPVPTTHHSSSAGADASTADQRRYPHDADTRAKTREPATREPGAQPGTREPGTRPGTREPGVTRTILSSGPESIAERRAARTRPTPTTRVEEPTVELNLDSPRQTPDAPRTTPRPANPTPTAPPQTVGRWWSGQPVEDDDETTVEEAPWAAEQTLETNPPATPPRRNPFRRRPR